MDKAYISNLLFRYITNQATHPEREALFAELERYSNNEDWADILASLQLPVEEDKNYNPEHYQPIIESILRRHTIPTNGHAKVVPMYKKKAFRWAVAACIAFIVAVSAYVILSGVEGRHTQPPIATTHDVPAPSNTRAVITLADGSKVYLDSAENGTIAQESNVSVVKDANGGIKYMSPAGGGGNGMSPSGGGAQRAGEDKRPGVVQVSYNSLFDPRGSKVISLTLSDGTKVWLNSESSLKYPTTFTANTREVEITGEAYFEVKHNAKQPFKVHLPNGGVVEDIGTAFNLNAYTDEEAIKTTLIEGSVRVSPAGGGGLDESSNNKRPGVVNGGLVLKPGQQAAFNPTTHSLLTTNSVDLEETVAWKNNLFQFNNLPIETIMKQVARWYDVDVVYSGTIRQTFNGKIPRTVNASDLFKILESTGWVHFKIEGKKVIVQP